jgi:hypothetical protein
MPSFSFVYNFVCENFENVTVKGNQFLARCPLCGDSLKSKRKKRFGLKYNDKNTVYHCYNCENSGSFYKLYAIIKKIDINTAYNECESISSTFNNILNNFLPKKDIVRKPATTNFNWITSECLNEYSREPGLIYDSYVETLRKFRKDRKIPSNIPLFISYTGRYKGRIIIPVYDINGDIIYFQARRTIENIQPKYLNPDFPKEIIIPNFDYFDPDKPIVIVEGLLDCYSIGKQSTSCLGKEVDDAFIRRIRKKCKNIIIALDNDKEGKKAMIHIRNNSTFCKSLQYFIMPYNNIKDINELLVQNNTQNINIYKFIIDNSYDYKTCYIEIMKRGIK